MSLARRDRTMNEVGSSSGRIRAANFGDLCYAVLYQASMKGLSVHMQGQVMHALSHERVLKFKAWWVCATLQQRRPIDRQKQVIVLWLAKPPYLSEMITPSTGWH